MPAAWVKQEAAAEVFRRGDHLGLDEHSGFAAGAVR